FIPLLVPGPRPPDDRYATAGKSKFGCQATGSLRVSNCTRDQSNACARANQCRKFIKGVGVESARHRLTTSEDERRIIRTREMCACFRSSSVEGSTLVETSVEGSSPNILKDESHSPELQKEFLFSL